MTLIDAGFASAAILFLAAIAVADCRAMRIPPVAAALLAATGIAWHATTPSDLGLVSAAWWMPVAGLAVGIAVPASMMAWAEASRRRWPLMPGDALLLGGIGAVSGPLGLAWSLAAGSACSLIYRAHLQARRNRPFARGYAPLAPGMAAGSALVIAAIASGAACAQDGDDVIVTRDAEALAAVVLAPQPEPGPPGAAGEIVYVDTGEALTLPELGARMEAATGRRIVIEERPSRTGVATALETAAPRAIAWEGSVTGLFDHAAQRHGYRWEWRGEAVVFYRYWDAEFAATLEPGPDVIQARWVIDTATEATLAEVLDRWAGEAGWSLVWSASNDYRLGADAVFEGSFLGAVDALLADPVASATLTATAYQANRQLVIEEAP